MLSVGSLFAGIGGFDLGFERAGCRIAFQVEIDPFATAVLAKHWPEVPKFADIRSVSATTLPRVDVLCGGFPCQDISLAGKGAGIAEGTRSGLWSEYHRLICELRPRYVVVENVAALKSRGLDRVLGDLAASGYDAEWDCIPACAIGAPHRRDRLWIVAYPASGRGERRWTAGLEASGGRALHVLAGSSEGPADVAHTIGESTQPDRAAGHVGGTSSPHQGREEERERFRDAADGGGSNVADANRERLEGQRSHGDTEGRQGSVLGSLGLRHGTGHQQEWWATEPNVGRVAHGIPARVDRLRGLGNAIVPQIAEWIAHQILADVARQEGAVA